MIVHDAHQSGHATATAAQRPVALKGLAAHATVGVLTEAVGIGPAMVDGWSSCGAETKVLWNTARWSLEKHGTIVLPTPAWTRGTSHRTAVDLTWGLLADVETSLLLLRVGGHLPAHLFKSAQMAANKAALAQLGAVLSALTARHTPAVTTASFDFNRDLRQTSQQKVIREAVAGTGLHLVVPPKGTRGLRKIDGFLTTGELPETHMLPRCKGFDHRGVRLVSCGCPKAAA